MRSSNKVDQRSLWHSNHCFPIKRARYRMWWGWYLLVGEGFSTGGTLHLFIGSSDAHRCWMNYFFINHVMGLWQIDLVYHFWGYADFHFTDVYWTYRFLYLIYWSFLFDAPVLMLQLFVHLFKNMHVSLLIADCLRISILVQLGLLDKWAQEGWGHISKCLTWIWLNIQHHYI